MDSKISMLAIWLACAALTHVVLTVIDPIANWSILMSVVASLIYAIPLIVGIKTASAIWRRTRFADAT